MVRRGGGTLADAGVVCGTGTLVGFFVTGFLGGGFLVVVNDVGAAALGFWSTD